MSKYKTKPIDFTGCDPVIAEHLKRGEAVLCKVGQSDTRAYVTGYDRREPFPYKVDGNAYKHAEPIEIKLYWRKASEIVKWLEDNGWTPDFNGDWWKLGDKGKWHASWFHFCGTEACNEQVDHKPAAWFEER